MQFLVLHLSDAHFKPTNNFLSARAEAIASATLSCAADASALLVAFTGDLANTGAAEEYEVASAFMTRLKAALAAAGIPVYFLFVPGNHDCDFRAQSDVRLTLNDFPVEKLVGIDPTGDIARHSLAVQNNFFAFASRFNDYAPPSTDQQIIFRQDIVVGTKLVRVQSYNTAWLSQHHEQQGRLCIPAALLSVDATDDSPDLAIALFHHSYPWLEAANGRSFREHVERTSDLVLTGHDHVSDSYSKHSLTGAVARYTEGDVLQSSHPTHSAFNVILLDIDGKREKVYRYVWDTDIYRRATEPDWIPFLRNPALAIGRFHNNDQYVRYLSDPGSGFTHRYKKEIRLDDLYVHPDLRVYTPKPTPDPDIPSRASLKGEELPTFVAQHRRVVIIGAERSGKTSLCKVLYSSLQMSSIHVPVLLSGDDIRSAAPGRFDALVETQFVAQYSQQLLERFRQLPPAARVLLIDDFDRVKLNRRGQKQLVDQATIRFDTVVVFADELFRLEELTGTLDAEHPFHSFEQCQLQDFGHVLRGELIDRWCRLGREYTALADELAHDVATAEQLVTTIIGRNLLPSSPITILTMLQAHEAGQQQNMISGSYGYIYEVLITAALSRVSSKGADIDTKYTFLALLAYHLFTVERESASLGELHGLQERYFDRYRVRLSLDQILIDLEGSRLLQDLGHAYAFRYKYAYYYFVARYLRDNLEEESLEIRAALNEMADKVYYEEYANVLMFFVYLTRDRGVIERLLANATQIYSEHQPCDFDSHVEFINALFQSGSQGLALPSEDHVDHRKEYRKQLDLDLQSDASDTAAVLKDRRIIYDRRLDDVIKINIALRTLDILGQVLRNFPGSLRGDLKAHLAEQSYLLGLRTLRALLGVAETNLEDLRLYFASVIKERRVVKDRTERELAQNADELLIWTSVGCAYSLVKRVSSAVGLEQLNETYREVLERSSNHTSFALIDAAIKLDHFTAFPDGEVTDLAKKFRKNYFGWRMLRHLVVDYLYLFPVDYRIRQSMGEMFEFKSSHPKLIENPHKRLRE